MRNTLVRFLVCLFVLFPFLGMNPSTASAASTDWNAISGGTWTFTSTGGTLTNPANEPLGNANIAISPYSAGNAFSLSAQMQVVPTQHEWNDFSLIFGYTDKDNYYYISLNERNDKNTNGIFQTTAGQPHQLIDIKTKIKAGTTYHLQVDRQDTTLSVFLDGQLIVHYLSESDLSGYAGVGSRNDEIIFSNLSLQDRSTDSEATIQNSTSTLIDLSNWKLTLPTGESESPTEILSPALLTFEQSPYFVVEEDGLRFRAPTNGVTTSGSSYPRSELREMTEYGITKAAWSTTSGVHTMFIDQAITATPQTKPHVVAGQIHDASDDVIVIRLEGTTLFVDINGVEGPILDANYELGKRFTVKFVAENEKISIYYNGSTNPVFVLNASISGLYFKAGAYTQSNCEKESACGENNYGEVKIYGLEVNHQ